MIASILQNNLAIIRENISQSAQKAGRRSEDITLVAVTKTIPCNIVKELFTLGVQHVGENRVIEAKDKIDNMPNIPFTWHLIGHLQTNKVAVALQLFSHIHSVDTVSLAQVLSSKAKKDISIFLEINTCGEKSKQGFPPNRLWSCIETILALPHLQIQGLMTMAPKSDDMEICRRCFVALRELRQKLEEKYKGCLNLQHLSMGMFQDYIVAIEEGATMVRVGSAIFANIPTIA